MKSLVKKLCFSFSLLLLGMCHAETLFFKKDGSAITAQEHAILYPIMLKYQFPTSQLFGTYVDDEIQGMNDHIEKQLPDSGIQACFIPTTLYHLFCLKYIGENVAKIGSATSGVLARCFDQRYHISCQDDVCVADSDAGKFQYSNICEPKIVDLDSYYDDRISSYFMFEPDEHNLNLKQQTINFHRTINNYIVSCIKAMNFPVPIQLDDLAKIVDVMDFEKILNLERCEACDDLFQHNRFSKKNMIYAINLESKAYSQKQYVLYRGTPTVEGSQQPFPENHLFSFGSTLLGGIIFDGEACAYEYLKIFGGYALLIDKKEFMQGDLKNMFFIPPIISLLDLLGTEALFHARSKVPDFNTCRSQPGMCSGCTHEDYEKFKNSAKRWFQIAADSRAEAEEVYSRMLAYIQKNHVKFPVN